MNKFFIKSDESDFLEEKDGGTIVPYYEITQGMIAEYFETIDYIKKCLLNVEPEKVEEYQALLGRYELLLDDIIIKGE